MAGFKQALDEDLRAMDVSNVGQRRQYKNPPIQEALVEFQFESREWNMTIPGRIHQELKGVYDGKPLQQQLALGFGGPEAGVSAIQPIGRVQIPNIARTKLVSIGQNVVSAHVLPPYPGWDSFRADVERTLAAYVRVAAPGAVRRIGLRYINKVTLPTDVADLRKYFSGVATEPSIGIVPRKSFVHRDEFFYDGGAQLLLTFAQSPQEPEALLLDLDLVWGQKIDPDEAMAVVDLLRERERAAFEQLITEDLREVFDRD